MTDTHLSGGVLHVAPYRINDDTDVVLKVTGPGEFSPAAVTIALTPAEVAQWAAALAPHAAEPARVSSQAGLATIRPNLTPGGDAA